MPFIPDSYGRVGIELLSAKSGSILTHYTSSSYSTYNGTQYKPFVKVPFNREPRANKVWYKMRLLSDKKMECPTISVPANDDYASGMLSRLKSVHINSYEGHWWANFLRDMNDTSAAFLSITNLATRQSTALLNGRRLKGQVLVVTFQAIDGSTPNTIRSADVYFDYSGKTNP